MPSPFPGMDPYLENPGQWESFHGCLIGVVHEMLQARLRPRFLVLQQATVYVVEPGTLLSPRQPIKPDVYLVDAGRPSDVAVAERTVTPPTLVTARYPDEIRQRYLEIRDRASRAVVAMIEVLSPTNKARYSSGRTEHGSGYDQFDRKRRDVMASPVHWLEIDLLRAGDRPPEMAGESDYCVLLKRGEPPHPDPDVNAGEIQFPVWFVDLRDPLPVVSVPLVPDIPDMALDLGAALAIVYDRFYDGLVDYAEPPPAPPLSRADAAWAERCIAAWRGEQPAENGQTARECGGH